MQRLIDADALPVAKEYCVDEAGFGATFYVVHKAVIDNAPTIDAVPVVHGRWEEKPSGAYGRWQSWCSACGRRSGIGGIESNRHKPYCPNCGAKMDLEVEGE